MYATNIEFIYLISFNGVTGNIITNQDNMVEVINRANKHGIAFIKVFDSVKNKFVRLSKDKLRNQVDYNTELTLILEARNYL